MADPTSPTLAALDAVIDYLDHVRHRGPHSSSAYMNIFDDGCGTITVWGRRFGNVMHPIAEAYEQVEAWLAGTDEATRALDSEIGENVDHIFAGTAT